MKEDYLYNYILSSENHENKIAKTNSLKDNLGFFKVQNDYILNNLYNESLTLLDYFNLYNYLDLTNQLTDEFSDYIVNKYQYQSLDSLVLFFNGKKIIKNIYNIVTPEIINGTINVSTKVLKNLLKYNYDEKVVAAYLKNKSLTVNELVFLYPLIKDKKLLVSKFDFNNNISIKDALILIANISDLSSYISPKTIERLIKNNIDNEEVADLIEYLHPQLNKETQDFIIANSDKYLSRIIERDTNEFKSNLRIELDNNQHENVKDILLLFFKDIIKMEKCDVLDVELLDVGGYSYAYKIGNKVLKYGDERETYNVLNSKYILQPYVRKQIKELNNFTIEVEDFVDTHNITEDDVKEVFFHLLDDGILATDIKPKNFGRLINDNKALIVSKNNSFETNPKMKGFNKRVDTLPAGSVVIIDSDYLFPKDKGYKVPYGINKSIIDDWRIDYKEMKHNESINNRRK